MKPSIIPMPNSIRYLNGSSKINSDTSVTKSIKNSYGSEEYSLNIDNNRILIEAGSEVGLHYAEQTLSQIKDTCNGICDNLIIEDKPRFRHRGFMVDCCRHFYNTDQLKTIIDTAANVKMNVFHWHLTDDQGWRLPVDRYPELTEIGGKRSNSLFGNVNEGKEYAASFTKDEIREIISYCSERNIDVIPEFEMPGHITSLLAAHPEFGCTGEKVEVTTKQGIFDTVLCLGNNDAIQFIKYILDEICDLFPGEYIHIGGDEAPRKRWMDCEKCKAKMKELNTDSYDVLQGAFIKEICDYLKSKGKKTISWNESLKGNVLSGDDVVIQRWMDKNKLAYKFADNGGKIIQSDFYHYYCDYPYGMTPVSKTYNYDPVKGVSSEKSVMGLEAELWTEYIRSFDDVCEKMYPRMFAVAESAWTYGENKNYKSFVARHENLRKHFESYGISIIPVEKWSYMPLHRLGDILSFFKGSYDIKNITNSLNNSKKS